jgi:hypothetical protein
MFVHEILIVPAYGHSTDRDLWDRGPAVGSVTGLDVVDAYVSALIEELDAEGIRYRVLDTRTSPGIRESERWQHVEANSLVLHCLASGLPDGKKPVNKKNQTEVWYGGDRSLTLADEMCEALAQWGHCYVFGHRTANPRHDGKTHLLNAPETKALAISPFWINGPDAPDYLERLNELGQTIARCLADHLTSKGHAQVYPPRAAKPGA